MGILSLFGLTQGIELYLWIVIAFVAAYLFARKLTAKHFLTGLIAGLFMGLINGLMQGGFYDMYIANNPEVAQRLQEQPIPAGMSPAFFILLTSPIVGLIYGLFVGLFSFVAAKILKKHPEPQGQVEEKQ